MGKVSHPGQPIRRRISDLAGQSVGTDRACHQGMRPEEGALRVLVVDDEALIRWAVTETLTRAGHDVLQASDARSALRALADAGRALDVALLDLRLPDSSDLTLLSRIRVLLPDCAVVLMSAHVSAEVAAEARAMGAFDVLPKPFDLDGCEQTLRQARSAIRH